MQKNIQVFLSPAIIKVLLVTAAVKPENKINIILH